jgi:hypothetical protein
MNTKFFFIYTRESGSLDEQGSMLIGFDRYSPFTLEYLV